MIQLPLPGWCPELLRRAVEAARILWGRPVNLPPYQPDQRKD